jgi:hypothetical protein
MARRGPAWQYVTWYGNQDNFSGSGAARRGMARHGSAWQGKTPAGGRYHRTLSVNNNKAIKAKQHEANQSQTHRAKAPHHAQRPDGGSD